jgi:two-component system chemotaxis sensor kinase CheA
MCRSRRLVGNRATNLKPFPNRLAPLANGVGGARPELPRGQGRYMDELLREFLTETNESLDLIDVEVVRFEQDPNNAKILDNIFRLVHTIKGTCGFLGLPRLQTLAHSAETLMGRFRDGLAVTAEAVTLVLATLDRIKEILGELERTEREPEGSDRDLIGMLEAMAAGEAAASAISSARTTSGSLVYQVLERRLRPGEVPLDDLERAFRETPGPADQSAAAAATRHAEPEGKPRADRAAARDKDEDRPDKAVASQSIRVNVETLERLMTMVSELVLTRNQLLEIGRRHEDSEFKAPLQRLSNVTAELQEGVMKTRMQPIGNAWQKLPRIVRDLAADLGKEIELEMHGAETELDRQVLDLIKDPLTHMVRNCADHGLENPAERRNAGKPEKGTIRLSAYHEGGHIIIQIADDGRGLDTDRIKAKAVASGLASESEAEKMTEAQIHNFIFRPGFSTAAQVTSLSGRGIGMDIVRANIDQIGGTIDVKSVPGAGSSFSIKIPLTLAIISALIVEAGGDRFAIPQLSVVELVRAQSNSEHRIERIRHTPVLRLRNKLLPLARLDELLGIAGAAGSELEKGFIVVVQIGTQTFGIMVDAVFHTEEIVVKPMSTKLRHIPMFSGNTILGDGSVILIIDPNGIAQAIGTGAAQLPQPAADAQRTEAEVKTVSLLVFRAGSAELKAVPLSLVTRLEEIDCRKIEISGGRHLVQYRGQLMPLVRLQDEFQIRTEGTQPLLVFSDRGRSMGLAVDEIVDIVEDKLEIEVPGETSGSLGSAVIRGRATQVIDVGYFLPLAFQDWFRRNDAIVAGAPKSLLLVDDSAFFRNMLAPVLKAAGYEVTAASDAQQALAMLKSGREFHVVVSDIEMPGMSGYQLAEWVRAESRNANVTLIALSALASEAMIERGRRAGFDAFVGKFDRQGLIAALKQASRQWVEAA